ncbi:UNVERIFIED_CONTAM: hypothetical protein K2H54_011028, partial [Gekko kuhli]
DIEIQSMLIMEETCVIPAEITYGPQLQIKEEVNMRQCAQSEVKSSGCCQTKEYSDSRTISTEIKGRKLKKFFYLKREPPKKKRQGTYLINPKEKRKKKGKNTVEGNQS